MDEARALETLRTILARPEFAPRERGGFWDTFWDVLWDLLVDLWAWLTAPVQQAVQGHLLWRDLALLALAVLVLLAGIVFLARTVRGHMVTQAAAGTYETARRRERSDRLWTQADALARAGQLEDAVRALYLAALYALEERHVLSVQDAWTNVEHAQRLAHARPGAGAAFAAVVQRYDGLRYGGATIDETAFRDLRALVERARTLALTTGNSTATDGPGGAPAGPGAGPGPTTPASPAAPPGTAAGATGAAA